MNNMRLKIMILQKFQTQINFANEIGVTEQKVCRVVTGREKLEDTEKVYWVKALECKVEEIF